MATRRVARPLFALLLLLPLGMTARVAAAVDFVQIPMHVVPGSVEWEYAYRTWEPAELPFVRVKAGQGGNCAGSQIGVQLDVHDGSLDAKIETDVRSLAKRGDWAEYCTLAISLRFEIEVDVPDFGSGSTLVLPVKWKREKSFLYGDPRVVIQVGSFYATSAKLEGRRFLLVDDFGDLDGEDDFNDGFVDGPGVAVAGDRVRLPITVTLQATHFVWETIPAAIGVLERRFELWAVTPTRRSERGLRPSTHPRPDVRARTECRELGSSPP